MIGRIRLLIVLAVINCCDIAVAESIIGTVRDSKGSPLEYVNVALLAANDSTYLTGSVTDSVGKYSITLPDTYKGNYLVKASALGFESKYLPFIQNPCDISLDENVQSLGEVVVKGQKKSFSLTPTGIKTQIAGTSLSQLSSADEILSFIPGLFRNSSGDYVIAGKGTPVFYLNGRMVYDYSEIQSLSPNSIKDIEIVRNPGASYSSGINSVVRITTMRKPGDGFSSYLRASYYYWTNSDFFGQFNWNYRHNGFDFFGNHSFGSYDTESKSDLSQTLYSESTWEQRNRQESLMKSRIFKNTIGINYIIDSKNTVGIKYNIYFPLNTLDKGTLASYVTENGRPYDDLVSHNTSKNKAPASHHLTAYYTGKYGNISLGAEATYLSNSQSSFNTYSETSANYEDRVVNTKGDVSNSLFASKVYSEMKMSRLSLTVGVDYSMTRRKNNYFNEENIIDNREDNMREYHLSPYLDATLNVGNGQISAGLRYEKVWTKYLTDKKDPFRRDYDNLFPTVSVFYPIGNVALSASYSIKDRKPSYSMLRNEITYGNRFMYQTGNPYLKPEKKHNLNLSMVYKWLQFAFDYTDRRDAIIYASDFYKQDRSIALISFTNTHSIKSVTGTVAISPSVGIWNPTLSFAVTRQWFTAETVYGKMKLDKPIFMTGMSNRFDFGKGWRLNLNLNFTSKGDSENCRMSRATFGLDMSLYKYFLDNNLSVSLGVTNLTDTRKSGNILYMQNLNTSQTEWNDSREINLTVTYRFNSAKNRYKGKGAGLEEQGRL